MPTSFLPNEDQGILTVEIQLGPGSTETETLKIVEQVERHFLENEKENVHGMMLTLGRASGGKGPKHPRAGTSASATGASAKILSGARGHHRPGESGFFLNHQCPCIRLRAPGDPLARQRHRL